MLAGNLDRLKETLARVVFDSEQPPIVVALKGGWGEGKTFFWKNNIAASYPRDRTGYVSVFGADTLQSIREKVLLAALLSRTKGILGKLVEILGRHTTALLKGLRIPDTLITQLLETRALKPGWILCLDDIERLSNSIGVDALLGYINELKDERKLKVVLIYNDEAAMKREAFRIYQEKVVDRELPFSPDVSAILRLVFQATPSINRDLDLVAELTRRCDFLKLRNIRLIVKVQSYYQELDRVLPLNADQQFRNAALFSLLLFVWVRFSKSAVPFLTLDFLSGYSELSAMLDKESAREPQQQDNSDRARELLMRYGYTFTDDLDTILIDFVQTDTLDTERLFQEYKKYAQHISKGTLERRFSEAWRKYFHGTLRNTEEEFCAELESAAREYIECIPEHQLDEALCMLARLGRNSTAELLLNDFLRLRGESLKHFERSSLTRPIKYRRFEEALREAEHTASIDRRSIGEVIESALATDFPRSADRKRLAQFSKQEFVEYFSNNDQEHLTSKIRQLGIQADKISNPEEDDTTIQTTVREAAAEIARQHRLNRLRMEAIGLIEPTNKEDC